MRHVTSTDEVEVGDYILNYNRRQDYVVVGKVFDKDVNYSNCCEFARIDEEFFAVKPRQTRFVTEECSGKFQEYEVFFDEAECNYILDEDEVLQYILTRSI